MTSPPDLIGALADEVNRIHLRHWATPASFDDWPWTVMTKPEPCEVCGTRVFALRDRTGKVGLFHVGWVRKRAGRDRCTAIEHTPERCSASKRFGVRLEGKPAEQMRALLNPPPDQANGDQMGLFG